MRLTKRKVCYPKSDKKGNLTKVDYIEIKDKGLAEEKLCQLEDIENELGIELVTLFKALKQNYVYVKTNVGIEKNKGFNLCGLEMWSQIKLNANDYGKTWALTKEELL